MAHVTADRVKDSTTTTGTGNVTLSGAAPSGFQTFGAVMANSDTCFYTIADQSGSNWEVGLGTYVSATPAVARTTVIASSNANALVNFGAGTKDVFLTAPAIKFAQEDNTGTVVLPDFGTSAPTVPTGVSAQIFSRQIANRKLPAYIGPSGLDSALQPLLARNKIGYWNPPGNATTLPGVFGVTAVTAYGTATARTVAVTNLATRMRRLGYPSSTTAGTFAGARVPVLQWSCGSGSNDGSGFFMVLRWVDSDPASVAGKRAFIGVRTASSALSNVEPNTLTGVVGIAQSSTDATQWQWYAAGSSVGAYAGVGAGVGAPGGSNSGTAWELAIFCPNSVANTYYLQLTNITTGAVASTTFSGAAAVVPQSSALVCPHLFATNNATAAAVGIDICSIYIETDTTGGLSHARL